MKNIFKKLWACIDTAAFNFFAMIIFAVAMFIGLTLGFSGVWYGWLLLALSFSALIYFIHDLNRVKDNPNPFRKLEGCEQ